MKPILTLLVLAAIVYLLWPGVRRVLRDAARTAEKPGSDRTPEVGRPADPPGIEADDLVKCGVCGTWVAAAGSPPCERAECPARAREPVA